MPRLRLLSIELSYRWIKRQCVIRCKHGLGFTLLADPDHAVAEAYGVWVEKSMYGKRYMGVQRSTFLIDPDGEVARAFSKVQPKQHDDLVLGALEELGA